MREVSSKSEMVTCRPLGHLSRNDPLVKVLRKRYPGLGLDRRHRGLDMKGKS